MTKSPSLWCPAPTRPLLGGDEVHVWRAGLDQPSSTVQSMLELLSPDERCRAGRFYFQRDFKRFVIARGLLRTILSLYLQLRPEQLRFCYSEFGKPELVSLTGQETLRFNVSHSHNQALFAFAHKWGIGVDIEYLRKNLASRELAECVFSPNEIDMLCALPAHRQTEGFFNCWTRKEAYIKARGEGLSFPLDCFDVSLAPGEPAALLSHRKDSREIRRWSLRELASETGYAAAIAVESSNWRLSCWHWDNHLI